MLHVIHYILFIWNEDKCARTVFKTVSSFVSEMYTANALKISGTKYNVSKYICENKNNRLSTVNNITKKF